MKSGGKTARGFTLVELMVVLAIIVAVMSVVLTGQGSFNKTLILTNTAYDIALSIRSAETYGFGGHAIGKAPVGYGLHFDKTIQDSYVFFADTYPDPISACHPTALNDPSALDAQPGNCSYDPGSDLPATVYKLNNGITVSNICAFSSGSWSCANSNGSTLSTLDIVFARPNPDTLMAMNGAYSSSFPITNACLALISPQDVTKPRFVSISSVGEIDPAATHCP